MKNTKIIRKVLMVLLSMLVSMGTLSACSQSGGDNGGDGEQVSKYEYSTTIESIDLDYGSLVVSDISCTGEYIYVLYTTLYDADEEKENVQYVVILDMDQNVVREIPYQADIPDVSLAHVKAATDGSYWTQETSKWPGSKDQYLRHYDEFGNVLLTIRPGDLLEGSNYRFTIAAVDKLGRAYVAIDSGRGSTVDDWLALIDKEGKLVCSWDEFSTQIWMTILDDGAPIVRETNGGPNIIEPYGYNNLYSITEDGGAVLLTDLNDQEKEYGLSFGIEMFAGAGQEIFFEEGFTLYRLSLDNLTVEAVADWSELEKTSTFTPYLNELYVASENLMYGFISNRTTITMITFEK